MKRKNNKIGTLDYIIEQVEEMLELAKALKKDPVYQEDIDTLSSYAVDIQNTTDDLVVEATDEDE